MMTCLFNFSGLRIVNYLTFTFTFFIRADGNSNYNYLYLWLGWRVSCSVVEIGRLQPPENLGCHSSRDYLLGII